MCKCTPSIRTPFCGKADCAYPSLKEPYELNEIEQQIIKRFKEELDYRLKTNVEFEIYTENFLAHPKPLHDTIKFEIKAGNWKRIMSLGKVELEVSSGEVFFYFMRGLVDETMQDLLVRGANTY